jgi:hypothetical protein
MDEAEAALENRQKSYEIFSQMVDGIIKVHA